MEDQSHTSSWDWKYCLPWSPAPRESHPHGSEWHRPRLSKPPQLPTPLQLGSTELGSELWSHSLSVAPALGYCIATGAQSRVAHLLLRPDAKGSNLVVGRKVFCRQCLPVPGAQGFPSTAVLYIVVILPWSPSLSYLITALPPPPYIGSSVKVWVWSVDPDDWKLSLEIQQSSQGLPLPSALFCLVQLPKKQMLDFPSSHCRKVSWENE